MGGRAGFCSNLVDEGSLVEGNGSEVGRSWYGRPHSPDCQKTEIETMNSFTRDFNVPTREEYSRVVTLNP